MYNQYLKPYLEDDLFAVCSLFLFAFILRLSFLPHLIHDPAFVQPMVESGHFNWYAYELINLTGWRVTQFAPFAPGYAYFAALVYKILGFSVVRLAVVQYVLGSLCACLVFILTKRLISRRAAFFAGFLTSVYWMPIYTQSHLFSENLAMFLNLSAVTVLLISYDSWRKYLTGGIFLGISAVVRSEILIFAAFLLVWLLFRKLPLKAVFKYYVFFALGVGLCVLPVCARNYQLSGNFMVQRLTGISLYTGSVPAYTGSSSAILAEERRHELVSEFWSEWFERGNQGREPAEKDWHTFYMSKTFEFIRGHPLQWAGFMAGKSACVLLGIDFLRPEDAYFYDTHIRGGAYALIQTWFIFILGVAGIGLSLKRRPEGFMLLLLFLASFLPALLLDFHTRRLIACLPVFIVFSSYAFAVLAGHFQQGRLREAASFLGVVLMLYACVKWNPLGVVWPSKAEAFSLIGENFVYSGHLEEAERFYLKALEADPGLDVAVNRLGVVYMQSGKFSLAAETFQKAIRIRPRPEYAINYRMAQDILERGGVFDLRGQYSDEVIKNIELYYTYFPYPYQGPVFHKTAVP